MSKLACDNYSAKFDSNYFATPMSNSTAYTRAPSVYTTASKNSSTKKRDSKYYSKNQSESINLGRKR